MDGGRLEGRLSASVVDLSATTGLGPPDSLLDRDYAERHFDEFKRVLEDRLRLSADGRPVKPRWRTFFVERERRLLAIQWDAELDARPARITVDGPIFRYDPWHETYVNVHEGGTLRQQDLLDRDRPRFTYYTGTVWGRFEVL